MSGDKVNSALSYGIAVLLFVAATAWICFNYDTLKAKITKAPTQSSIPGLDMKPAVDWSKVNTEVMNRLADEHARRFRDMNSRNAVPNYQPPSAPGFRR